MLDLSVSNDGSKEACGIELLIDAFSECEEPLEDDEEWLLLSLTFFGRLGDSVGICAAGSVFADNLAIEIAA